MTHNRTQNTEPVLAVQGLTVRLAGETRLSGLSFSVGAGERVCLLGASGSGKSLTAKAITGTLPAGATLSGSIRVNGVGVCGRHPVSRCAASRVATVFQDSSTALNPLMTLGKQLRLALPAAREDELRTMLDAVGLGDITQFYARYPAELSGGQRQRLCLALAMQSASSLLVADEPTTALDVLTQQQVLQVMRNACASPQSPRALLFITHDIAVAAQLCERALVMENGVLVESAGMAQLLSHPQHPYSQKLVHAARQAAALHQNAASLYGVAI
ncbi:ATP-binding component of an ABC superfamily transporter [Rahnella aquatilis CIP 78.65 = ATCC 33071]|uniref:ATPase component of various ABC-type transport systems with duplicated ATPase domain n=1 Tax=Rahnella aquatilis (strain ATCC 33071 / DSM 4594 / JCM 1683 / NBRC 105701 / NCIMB 13365 / CIP 78.65) TaxID=745277 RepID=H2J1Q6_RAHAC|nr:ABC transporter ATP-binding protein [Rahnella aquatilis]AEX54503.1 ATPase component of various ABC-type transport systems with duplicated ATPase domain [Rahnella aquatilis CIP 78.65 = ATCC 33071]KFC99894.1 ATP-binding component of an ABC superfamily transporter [Rahnella aquatilis CIP 78.65 = ATCC 33071]